MRFAILIIAISMLVGCSSIRRALDSPAQGTREVDVSLVKRGPYAGLRSGPFDHSTVTVDPNMPPDMRKRVMVHELLHVAGLKSHESSPSCFIYDSARPELPEHLCPQELKRLQSVTGTIIVYPDETSLEDCQWAVDFLNQEAGREVFILRLEKQPEIDTRPEERVEPEKCPPSG